MSLRVKNWSHFQHYRNRTPPWVKLHRDLLNDMDYAMLDPLAAKCLPLIWLLASETVDGTLPDSRVLAFRLRIPETECSKVISALSSWLEQDASNALASRQQDAITETEGETEGEGKKETDTKQVTTKTKYGEFKNVALADEEYAKLSEKMGEYRLKKGINILDSYIETKGKRYKSHYAVMKEGGWVWTRVFEGSPGQPIRLGGGVSLDDI